MTCPFPPEIWPLIFAHFTLRQIRTPVCRAWRDQFPRSVINARVDEYLCRFPHHPPYNGRQSETEQSIMTVLRDTQRVQLGVAGAIIDCYIQFRPRLDQTMPHDYNALALERSVFMTARTELFTKDDGVEGRYGSAELRRKRVINEAIVIAARELAKLARQFDT